MIRKTFLSLVAVAMTFATLGGTASILDAQVAQTAPVAQVA